MNNPISIDEVLKAINGCKSGKSPGEDLLLNEFLKYGQHILAAPLSKLFSHFLDIGYFPVTWTEGVIIPLHKKGDIHVHDINNYRVITLLKPQLHIPESGAE